jgi:hypothetical protein
MKNARYNDHKKVGYTRGIAARVLGAAGQMNTHGDQLKRTTRELHTRVSKCTEVIGEIFKNVLCTLKNCHLNIPL